VPRHTFTQKTGDISCCDQASGCGTTTPARAAGLARSRQPAGTADTDFDRVNFNNTNAELRVGGLFNDAAGDLFGTTEYGWAYGGTVFDVVNTGGGSYAGGRP
jgi:hypothetical protein